jgi:choline/ethanolamine kinase
LTTAELSDSRMSMKIAEKMGHIHSLHIPVSKEADWIFNTLNRWFNNIDTIMNDIRNNNSNNNEDNKVLELQKRLSKVDLRSEAKWLKKIAESEAYPVVFCHNDLQEGNILFRQNNFVPPSLMETLDEELNNIDDLSPMLISCPKNKIEKGETIGGGRGDGGGGGGLNNNGNSRKRSLVDMDSELTDSTSNDTTSSSTVDEPELMIIDFEYCAYNYRGFDIANHFLEWTYDYTNNKFPFFTHRSSQYPNAQQIDNFITTYLSIANSCDDDEERYVPTQEDKEQLLSEIALFSLASHLFWTTWAIVNIHQEIEFGYFEYAEIRLKEYFDAKEKYLEMRPSARDICNIEERRK